MRALRTCFPHTRAAVRKSSLEGSGFFRGGTRQSSLSRFSHVSTATPTSASAHEHVSRLAHRETRKTFAARYVHAVFEDTTVNRRRSTGGVDGDGGGSGDSGGGGDGSGGCYDATGGA